WGWGWADEALTPEQVGKVAGAIARRFDLADVPTAAPPDLDTIELRTPRIAPPSTLAAICSSERYDRAAHTYGKSYRDVVRAFRGELEDPPDAVAFPRDEEDVVAVLDWCAAVGAAAVPYGGGSSVVGGVDGGGRWADEFSGVVTIDLSRLDRVLEIDT